MSENQAENRTGKIQLDGHVDVPPNRWDRVLEALQQHIDLTQAEPGCITFSVTPCPQREGRLLVHEVFKDQAAFDAHQARAQASPWAEITAGIPREYTIKALP